MTNQIITVDDTNPGACINSGITVDGSIISSTKNMVINGSLNLTMGIVCDTVETGDITSNGDLICNTVSTNTLDCNTLQSGDASVNNLTITNTLDASNIPVEFHTVTIDDSLTTQNLTVTGDLTATTSNLSVESITATDSITTDDLTVTGDLTATTSNLSVESVTASNNVTADHITVQSSFDAPSADLSVASLTTSGDLTVNGTLSLPNTDLSVESITATDTVTTDDLTVTGSIYSVSADSSTIANLNIVGFCNCEDTMNINGPAVFNSEAILNNAAVCNSNLDVRGIFGRKVTTYPTNDDDLIANEETYLHRIQTSSDQTPLLRKNVFILDGQEGQEMVFKHIGGYPFVSIQPGIFWDGSSIHITEGQTAHIIWSGTSWQLIYTNGQLY